MQTTPYLVDYLNEVTGYTAIFMQPENETLLSVRFMTEVDMDELASKHNWNPEVISVESAEMSAGETITWISDNHLVITIRE